MRVSTLVLSTMTILAAPAVAQAPPPVPDKVPQTIASRVYFADTSTYDPISALGKIGIVDTDVNTVTQYIDISHFRCDPATALRTKVVALPDARSFYYVFTKEYSGSLSLFIGNASLSEKQRQEASMDDVGTADLDFSCQLDQRRLADIVRSNPAASGKRLFYVTGVTLSRLRKETFEETDAGGGISAGSWLSIDAKYYKGSNRIDSVPVLSLRGYAIEVPKNGRSKMVEDLDRDDAVVTSFASLKELGLNGSNVRFEKAVTPR